MGDASSYMEEAKRSIATFERELKDVSLSAEFSIEQGSFIWFADIFMDNVFVDVMVQSQISEAIAGLDQAAEQIKSILEKLYPLLKDQEV